MDCNPPGSSVHGILQAGILEWVVMPSSRVFSQLRDQPNILIQVGFSCARSLQSYPTVQDTWTIAQQAPLSMDSPGKTFGVGCHFFLQGIFLSQESNPCLLCLLTCQAVYHCIAWKPLFCKSVIFLIRKIKFTEL